MRTLKAIAVSMVIALAACTERPENETAVNREPRIFPDYAGVTIPAEIAPMNFNIVGEGDVECVDVTVTGSKGGNINANGGWADFDIDDWHRLTQQNRGGTLTFSVAVKSGGKWRRFKSFDMNVSNRPLKDWGVTYRKIAPGFETFSKIGIYQRCLSTFDEYPILESQAVHGQCLNCHYANRGNPDQMSIHIRGSHGATLLRANGRDTYLNTKTNQTVGSCTYGYWHPSGRYCAYSLNKIYQNFYTGKDRIIEPWDQASDIAVLDVNTNELLMTPLLMTDECETTPAFSADGRTLYFCHAPKKNMPAEYDKLKYSLCSIAFNAANGAFGAKVDTVLSAEKVGKSVSLPRPSYDGKWLMYCLTDYGTTPVNRMESDLYLLNLHTGESRLMNEVNSAETDAYHNWSTGGGWFLFGSKRGDHLYALLYFSCVDYDGRATKPFLLPQKNPEEFYRESLYSYNAPDFTARKVDLNVSEARSRIMSDARANVSVSVREH